MYLVSVYFDDKSNKINSDYINKIAQKTGNTFMTDNHVPPHLTIMSVEAREEDKLTEVMGKLERYLTKGQIQLVKDNVCANFKRTGDAEPDSYTYEQAIARYKLALYNSIVKRAKTSEKAYTCLKISWLYRQMAGMDAASEEEKAKRKEYWKPRTPKYTTGYLAIYAS